MKVDFEKMGGLVPAIVQDAETKTVLMLGYMNQEALDKTLKTKKVTFWSRSRNELWTKGETSGNFLHRVSIQGDCDNDAMVLLAIWVLIPVGLRRTRRIPFFFLPFCRISLMTVLRKCLKALIQPVFSRKA